MRTNLKGNLITLLIALLLIAEALLVYCNIKMSENEKEIMQTIEKQKQLIGSIAVESYIYADLNIAEDGTSLKNKIDNLRKEFEKNSQSLLMERNPIRIPGDFILTENVGIDEIKLIGDMKKEWESYKAIIDRILISKDKTELKNIYGENTPFIYNIIDKLTLSVGENISNNEKKLNYAMIINSGIILFLLIVAMFINTRFFYALGRLKKELKADTDIDRVSYISGRYCRDVESIKLLINNRNNKIENVVEGIRKNSEDAEISNNKLLKIVGELRVVYEKMKEESIVNTENAKKSADESIKLNDIIGTAEKYLMEISSFSNNGLGIILESIKETTNIKSASENGICIIKELNNKKNDMENIIENLMDASINVNIIALNAGIEATRAGEFGKGFEKISNQLTKMAAMMKIISKEIKKNILDINEKTEQIIDIMDGVNKTIEKGTDNAEELKEHYYQTHAKIDEAKVMTENISKLMIDNKSGIVTLYDGILVHDLSCAKIGDLLQKKEEADAEKKDNENKEEINEVLEMLK